MYLLKIANAQMNGWKKLQNLLPLQFQKRNFEIVLEKMYSIILAILREDIIRKGKGVRELIPHTCPIPILIPLNFKC